MNKNVSKKKLIIVISLISLLVVAAVATVVAVLASTVQKATSNVNVSYVVDGVGAKVSSSYAVVPLDEFATIERVSMTSDGSEEITFSVNQQTTNAQMSPSANLSFDANNHQIVFEYVFENLAETAFSLELLTSPIKDTEQTYNMTETYFVSNTQIAAESYRYKIDESEFLPQALVEQGDKVYVYISASVANANRNAFYGGTFSWALRMRETINITLNNDGETQTQKIIPVSEELANIAMPFVEMPTNNNGTAIAYYSGTTQYVTLGGKSAHIADLEEGAVLDAVWSDHLIIEDTSLVGLTSTGKTSDTVTVIDGITSIGASAFDGAAATTVNIANSVETIEDSAFAGNGNLTTVTFGQTESLSYADEYAESKLRKIGTSVFSGCSKLTNFTIPDSVVTLGNYAFNGCSKLTKINIPKRVESIGAYCFSTYYTLKEVTFEEGSRLKSIGNYAFNRAGITTISLPDSVTSVGSYLFHDARYLESVHIPTSLTTLSEGMFWSCDLLDNVVVPESVKKLNMPFYGCGSLKNIKLPSNLTTIHYGAFALCSSLESIEIPSGVTFSGSETFGGCKSLKSVIFKGNFNNIGSVAFKNCTSLETITIPSTVTSIGKSAFLGCTALKSIEIPSGVTKINDTTFSGCTALADVVIPSTVKSIGADAFLNCSSLNYNEYENAYYLGNSDNPQMVFMKTTSNTTTNCVISENTKIIYGKAFETNRYLVHIRNLSGLTLSDYGYEPPEWAEVLSNSTDEFSSTLEEGDKYVLLTNDTDKVLLYAKSGTTFDDIPEGTTIIGHYAFNQRQMTSITIPNTVKTIGRYCFANMSALTTITIPNSVTFLGDNAFRTNVNIEEIIFEEGSQVTTIRAWTFANCYKLKNIQLPDSLTTITNDYAFYNCYALESIELPSTLQTIGNCAFQSCTSLKSIVIPDSVTTIVEAAFQYCESLESVTLPAGLTSLEAYMFRGLTKLSDITLPSSITTSKAQAFKNCTSLTSIVIPDAVTTIGTEAFSGCTALANVVLPKSLKSISDSAFNSCGALEFNEYDNGLYLGSSDNAYLMLFKAASTDITACNINQNTKIIYTNAFNRCSQLENLTIPQNVIRINGGAFQNCSKLIEITIPASVIYMGTYLLSGCSSMKYVHFESPTGWYKNGGNGVSTHTFLAVDNGNNHSALATAYSWYWFYK